MRLLEKDPDVMHAVRLRAIHASKVIESTEQHLGLQKCRLCFTARDDCALAAELRHDELLFWINVVVVTTHFTTLHFS